MNLETLLRDQVDARSRRQGMDYFQSGLSEVLSHSRDEIECAIHSTRCYPVILTRTPGEFVARCSCPHFNKGRICKHIWAAILTADATSLLQPRDDDPAAISLDNDFDVPDPDWEEHPDGDLDDDTKCDAETDPKGISLDSESPPAFTGPGRGLHPGIRPMEPLAWKDLVQRAQAVAEGAGALPYSHPGHPIAGSRLCYRLDVEATLQNMGVKLLLQTQRLKQDGKWSKPQPLRVFYDGMYDMDLSAADKSILAILQGPGNAYGGAYAPVRIHQHAYHLAPPLRDVLLPLLAEAGSCSLYWPSTDREYPLKLDPQEPPWVFHLECVRDPPGGDYHIRGYLKQDNERRAIETPVLLLSGGWVFWEREGARLNDSGAFPWIVLLRAQKDVIVPAAEADQLPALLYRFPLPPPIDLPKEFQYPEIVLPLKPRLTVKPGRIPGHIGSLPLQGFLRFEYGDVSLPADPPARAHLLTESRQILRRDPVAEAQARSTLKELGLRPYRYADPAGGPPALEIQPRLLQSLVVELMKRGWAVDAEGRAYRNPGQFKIDVSSGIDWFELRGTLDFDGISASLPALLQALKRRETTIVLDDGSIGMLPGDWLQRYGSIAALGELRKDHVRFENYQAGLLDAFLAAQPEATFDEAFRRIRDELGQFKSVQPLPPPATFVGDLRDYQKDGLGWFAFLQRFSFGGCLADDMGLGKTVQVLAFLESRRLLASHSPAGPGQPARPSLVVVPRSLVFNWLQEAARFTPHLRVLDHAHTTRERMKPDFSHHDLVITTYGILLRDIAVLKDIDFDYAILDEAQAIKNADAQVAKAARLLRCRHRLALSGTPIQNHLGDLWSLFDFLNPGMLGSASVFRHTVNFGAEVPPETRDLLARAIRPFILRRTKQQVARELPDRTEETLVCEMDRRQRRAYEELRDHYRKSLLARIERDGIRRSKIVILEALLRLRQAACHPGLIDPRLAADPCAKFDSLLPQLAEVLEEGHKAIVFSQFTSFLALLRGRLDNERTPYAYLDGKTRRRDEVVKQFQTDPDCRLFLISLKAGGLGLNLTEAEYVFLLDPWWNPAIEAQAIDRAHRIGQTRNVFAYRLITRDTVEEKVIKLQATKRALADSIISADNNLIRTLTRDDLALLLG